MPKHLIVDGFNIIRRNPRLKKIEDLNFGNAQDQLLQSLAQYRQGTRHKITVVFDGRQSQNWLRSHSQRYGIQVIYSAQGETADEVIQELSQKAASQNGILVATADRGLGRICQQAGAVLIEPNELTRNFSRPVTRPNAQQGPGPGFSPEGTTEIIDSAYGKKEETGWSGHTHKKGNPRRLPKTKRRPNSLW
jgi:uncharacterized protein